MSIMKSIQWLIFLLPFFSFLGQGDLRACACEPESNGDYITSWYQHFNDDQACKLGTNVGDSPLNVGDIVLVQNLAKNWRLGRVTKSSQAACDIAVDDNVIIHQVPNEVLKRAIPFLSRLYQAAPSAQQFLELIERAKEHLPNPVHAHGGSLQALIVPPDSKIIHNGDYHGDLRSLRTNLHVQYHKDLMNRDFVFEPNCYPVHTGDYGDRGPNGIGVWSLLLWLKCQNSHFFLLRGNHETDNIASRYGLKKELELTYGTEEVGRIWPALIDLFKRLPHALLIGSRCSESNRYRFGLFCHGGIEGHLTKALQDLIQEAIGMDMKNGASPTLVTHYFYETPTDNGLIWSDFYADDPEDKKACDYGISSSPRFLGLYDYGKAFIRRYLEENFKSQDKKYTYNLDMIARGHGHIPGGVVELRDYIVDDQHWKTLQTEHCYSISPYSVFTCTSSPEGAHEQGCYEDAFAIIDIDDKGKWSITPHIQEWRR